MERAVELYKKILSDAAQRRLTLEFTPTRETYVVEFKTAEEMREFWRTLGEKV